jgi:hypothetical protein
MLGFGARGFSDVKARIAIGLALFLTSCASRRTAPDERHPYRGVTLKSRAAEANAQGRHDVTLSFGGGDELPQIVRSLDDALAKFKVVIGSPIATQTVAEYGVEITTWYKFHISTAVSDRSPQGPSLTLSDLSDEVKPTKLLPIAKDEIVVLSRGGTVVVDGVTITEHHAPYPTFAASKTYLLFLENSPDNLAYIGMEGAGAFEIDHGKLVHLGTGNNRAVADVENLYDNSLTRLLKAIQTSK